MRRIMCSFCLLGLCLLAVPAFAAEDTASPKNAVDLLTGELWLKSSPEEKQAFLLGVDSTVTIEKYVNELLAKKAKKGQKPESTLSPFEKGWMKALKDVPRKEVAKSIDNWYADHSDQLERPVMAVLWYEIIHPRLHPAK